MSSSVAEFNVDDDNLNLTPYIEILTDPNHNQTIDSVQEDTSRLLFRPTQEVGNSFGFSKHTYWVTFTLKPSSESRKALLLSFDNPLIDDIQLFVPDGLGNFSIKKTGDTRPFSQRDIEYRNFLFKLPAHPGEERTYYMQLFTEGSMQIPLSVWTYDAFIKNIETTNFILGGYYGIMLLLMVAAFAFFLKIKDKLFLTYALYLLSYIIFQMSLNGLSYHYLWPDHPALTNRLTALSVGLVTIGALAFSGSFLQIWGLKHIKILSVFILIICLDFIGICISLFGDYSLGVRLLAVTGISLPPIVLLAGIYSVLQGYRPAKYFLIAWIVFLCGIFAAGLLFLGFLPHSFLTIYSMQIGSTIEVLLLGYALMDRISLLETDKQAATKQAAEYLEQSNYKLERLVMDRTRELEEKNEKLSQLTLIDSMTGLLTHNAAIELLNKQQSIAQRYHQELSVIMFDIDKFKSLNDTYGHPAGDKVITGISDILKSNFRHADYCGRYGGEEFIIILPKTSINSAIALAEHLRAMIRLLKIEEVDNVCVSASFGVSSMNADNLNEDLIFAADKALYHAKNSGRNNVKSTQVALN